MYMILADNTAYDSDFKRITGLTDQFSQSQGNIALQNPVSVFCHPYEVISDIKNCMTSISVIRKSSGLNDYLITNRRINLPA